MAEDGFCSACGTERATGAQFCATCGKAYSGPAIEPTPQPVQPLAETSKSQAAAVAVEAWGTTPLRVGSRNGPISRPAAVIVGILAVLLVGSIVWGATTAQTLSTTQGQLANASQQLSGTTTDLAASKAQVAQLGSDKGELTSANGQLTSDKTQLTSDKTQLTANVAQLTEQVSKQTQCIAALNANATELQRISGLASTNFNRSAKGSAWAKADTAALNDYYNAYRAAFSGQLSTANSWISKGNAAIKTKSTQSEFITDAATKKVEAAEAALGTALAQSATTCGF